LKRKKNLVLVVFMEIDQKPFHVSVPYVAVQQTYLDIN
jgi:hypothetical protein